MSYYDRVIEAVTMVGSHERSAVLAAIDPHRLTVVELRELLAMYWSSCDGVGMADAESIRDLFEYAAPVIDCTVDRVPSPGVLIYRAHLANTPATAGLSWTTSFEIAEWFAGYLLSPRAAFVGIPQGCTAVISAATCESVLGYFASREEREVIPGGIRNLYIAEGQCGGCGSTLYHDADCPHGVE